MKFSLPLLRNSERLSSSKMLTNAFSLLSSKNWQVLTKLLFVSKLQLPFKALLAFLTKTKFRPSSAPLS